MNDVVSTSVVLSCLHTLSQAIRPHNPWTTFKGSAHLDRELALLLTNPTPPLGLADAIDARTTELAHSTATAIEKLDIRRPDQFGEFEPMKGRHDPIGVDGQPLDVVIPDSGPALRRHLHEQSRIHQVIREASREFRVLADASLHCERAGETREYFELLRDMASTARNVTTFPQYDNPHYADYHRWVMMSGRLSAEVKNRPAGGNQTTSPLISQVPIPEASPSGALQMIYKKAASWVQRLRASSQS